MLAGFWFTGSEACVMTGEAWPVADWRNVMRGSSLEVCLSSRAGDGRCDVANNIAGDGCAMDGGDCCMSTCIANCVAKQPAAASLLDQPYLNPRGVSTECAYLCGARSVADASCPYLCLADDYVGAGASLTKWCSSTRGVQTPMSQCYSTQAQVVDMLIECLKNDASHGNDVTAHARCGNQANDCSLSDIAAKIDGCHLHPSSCTRQNCCSLAISKGWIDPSVTTLPAACELFAGCDATCMQTMAQCGRLSKACHGGCCMCANGDWYGHNCDQPLCWPKCKNGVCVSPNSCFCDSGWSGASCEIPVCAASCVAGQGVCVAPSTCECFYGFSGDRCETPVSQPPCVNGVAVAPDECFCNSGWGGRVCDYPICQSYPTPSADCGHGTCVEPWKCDCEPGWSLTTPLGADGLVQLPTYWKDRDTSDIIVTNAFVYGDSRFAQSAVYRHLFSEYNAFKCDTPNCRLIVDSRCKSCSADVCYSCDSGFFATAGRCQSCALAHAHCRQCDSTRCTACDPLFALVDGACVSDGIFEFSSPIYSVLESDLFVEVTVVRAVASAAAPRPVTVVVQTEADSAVSGSPDVFSNFADTRTEVVFPDATDWQQSVRIPIFNDPSFSGTAKMFKVHLLLPPERVGGSTVPLRPSEEAATYSPILTADVFVGDSKFFDPTMCTVSSAFLAASASIAIGASSLNVPIQCSECDGAVCSSTTIRTAASDEVKFAVSSVGSSVVVSSTSAGLYDAYSFLLLPARISTSAGSHFSIRVEALYPGIVARHYVLTAMPAPGQVADVSRLERTIDQEWASAQQAPPLAIYTGFLTFGCVVEAPSFVGVAVSQGASVVMTLDEVEVVSDQRALHASDSDTEWQAPLNTVACNTNLLCYQQSGLWTTTTVLRLNLSFKPSQLDYTRPAGVRLMMLSKDNVNDATPTWKVVPHGCLYGGIDIPDSPIRGLQTV